MKRVFNAVLMLSFAVAVVGCNTIQGVGKDVQKVGEKIEDASQKK